MDFYWSFLLTSAGAGGLVSVLWLSPWSSDVCRRGNPVLPGAGRSHWCHYDLLIVRIDNCQWGQWSGEGLPAWCPHVVMCLVTCYNVTRAQGQGQGRHIQQPFPLMSCCAAPMILWMLSLLKGVGVRGGRVVSDSGTWGERSVCLLIKQQQDLCVRVHSPCLPPSVRPKPDNSSKLRYNSLLNAGEQSLTLCCLWW